jgi:hypothetical protein
MLDTSQAISTKNAETAKTPTQHADWFCMRPLSHHPKSKAEAQIKGL